MKNETNKCSGCPHNKLLEATNWHYCDGDKCEVKIRADERAKVLLKISELKSMVNVNRLIDDIIHDKPKELGMLIAYDTVIKLLEKEQK